MYAEQNKQQNRRSQEFLFLLCSRFYWSYIQIFNHKFHVSLKQPVAKITRRDHSTGRQNEAFTDHQSAIIILTPEK